MQYISLVSSCCQETSNIKTEERDGGMGRREREGGEGEREKSEFYYSKLKILGSCQLPVLTICPC